MLFGFLEGLVGVEDNLKQFQRMKISPRWPAANVNAAEVQLCYENTGRMIGYNYKLSTEQILLTVKSQSSEVDFHVLLPEGTMAQKVSSENRELQFENKLVEQSRYVDFKEKVKG